MEMRQLEVFRSVADSRGFLAAAGKLHLSQSTVSAQVASLEQELQTELIRRTTRSFQLTPEGERLYVYAGDMLALRRKAEQELSGSEKKLLRIGSSSVPAQCIVPEVLAAFHERSPETEFQVVRGDSADIIGSVADGRLDLGFVGTKTDADCTFVPVAEDRLVLAMPNTPFYRELLGRRAPLRELLQCPFLMREESSGTQKEAERLLGELGIDVGALRSVARIGDAEMLRLCVAQGLGAAVLSERTVRDLAADGRILVTSPWEKELRRSLYLVSRAGKYPSRTVRGLLSLTEELLRKRK